MGEEVADVLGREVFDETLGHEGAAEVGGGADLVARNAAVFGAGGAEEEGVGGFLDQEAVADGAVGEDDTESPIRALHRGARREEVAEEGFDAGVADAVEGGGDRAPFAGELVAGEAEGREELFAAIGIAAGVGEHAEAREFFILHGGFGGGEEGGRIVGEVEASLALERAPGRAGEDVGEIGRGGEAAVEVVADLFCGAGNVPYPEF